MTQTRLSACRPTPPFRRRLYVGIFLAPALAVASSTAQSQTPPASVNEQASSPNSSGTTAPSKARLTEVEQLNAVEVVATRRNEPVREVPMQVNTISTTDLQRDGAVGLRDYLDMQPGINVNSFGSSAYGDVTIRGVTTGSAITSTVGIYVDDAAVTTSGAGSLGASLPLSLGLLDLKRIEVLRGPQGTLYGAGSMGGLLKYVTNVPSTDAFSTSLTSTLSDTSHGAFNSTFGGYVNVPIKEGVAGLRVSIFHDEQAGYVDAIGGAAGNRVDRGHTDGGRVSLILTPTDQLSIRLTANTQTLLRDGRNTVPYSVSGKAVYGDLAQSIAVREPTNQRFNLASADIEYDFGFARLNSITSTQNSNFYQRVDYTPYYGPLLPFLKTVALDQDVYSSKFTQELRLTSALGKYVDWLGGVFFTHEQAGNRQSLVATVPSGADFPGLFNAYLPNRYQEVAAYGDVTWHALPGLSVTAGLRGARNQQRFSQESSGLIAGGATSITTTSSDSSKTYLGTASYAIDAHNNVYFRTASGYRPGGPNSVVFTSGGQNAVQPTYQPDRLTSYEVGYKADLLDNRVSVQAAAYQINWHDLQQAYAVNGVSGIVNASDARIRGGELVVTYRPTEQWNFSASTSLIDALLTKDAPGLGALANARLPNSARFSAAAAARYLFTVQDYAAYAGVSERSIGTRNAGFENSTTLPNYRLGGYAVTDLQAGIDLKRFQVGAYVRNVFNRRGQASAYTGFVPLGGPALVTVEQPVTAGVTLSAFY